MKQSRNRDILFYIETEPQLESLLPLLLRLRSDAVISFDIVVPAARSNDTMKDKGVFDGCAAALEKEKFVVIRSVDGPVMPEVVVNTDYKVGLSAYIELWHYQNLNIRYRIMFPYASYYLNKPSWTIKQFIVQDYLADALISHAAGTKSLTDIFTKTHIVPSLKLMNYQKKKDSINASKKPVLFFAPTYSEIDFAQKFLSSINEIKQQYTVIMRSHHKTNYAGDNDFSALYDVADKLYSVDEHPITTPLAEADIVVSDNSAVIFDAIYCGVPVTLFSEDDNSFHYNDINTEQSKLVEAGDILWTNNPDLLLSNINRTVAQDMQERQKEMRGRLFPLDMESPVDQWLDVISRYLTDESPDDYRLIKRYWANHIHSQSVELERYREENLQLGKRAKMLDDAVTRESNPGINASMRKLKKAIIRRIAKGHK